MDQRTKVTKEVLCEESRFILANVLAEARYGRQNRYDDIRRVCEPAVTIPFNEYITFLEAAGYMQHDEAEGRLEVTALGEEIVNGGNLAELTAAAVAHFKNVRMRRRKDGSDVPLSEGPPPPPGAGDGRTRTAHGISSGGRPTAAVGGEIRGTAELDGRYQKIKVVGSGGIGTVYQARQIPLGRMVALKEIRELFGFFAEEQRPEIVRRFTDIVQKAGGLSHPNILAIHDVDLEREFPFVVTDLAAHGSARRLIQDAETIPVSLALRYLLETLYALRAAHKVGVFHRGLKPENMLLDGYGNIKVSDFGFARIVERDASVIRQVYVGMGAIAYMAPELFSDPTSAGAQADIYALGIIFYELLTRKLPGRRSPLPSEIDPMLPKGLDDIFDTMTRDSRTERYSKVDDILEDFDKIAGLHDVLGTRTTFNLEENPLAKIRFREPPPVDAGASTVEVSPEQVVTGTGETVAATAEAEDEKGKRRPYSFQQRHKKP